jgi:snurportin-1
MYAELLNLAEGLPADLAADWLVLGPVPKGKRCLVLTFPPAKGSTKGKVPADSRVSPARGRKTLTLCNSPHHSTRPGTNTLLLARRSGRPMSRNRTALPAHCILDAIVDQTRHLLWVLDVLTWVGTPLAETEAEFR